MAVKNEQFIVICNGVFRLFGNIVKILSYPFHALFPKKRFTIPEYSPAKIQSSIPSKITKPFGKRIILTKSPCQCMRIICLTA